MFLYVDMSKDEAVRLLQLCVNEVSLGYKIWMCW